MLVGELASSGEIDALIFELLLVGLQREALQEVAEVVGLLAVCDRALHHCVIGVTQDGIEHSAEFSLIGLRHLTT